LLASHVLCGVCGATSAVGVGCVVGGDVDAVSVSVSVSVLASTNWSDVVDLSEVGEGASNPVSADGTTQTIIWERWDGANWLAQVRTSAE